MPALLAAADKCTHVFDGQEALAMTPLMVAAVFGSTEVGQLLHKYPTTSHESHCLWEYTMRAVYTRLSIQQSAVAPRAGAEGAAGGRR